MSESPQQQAVWVFPPKKKRSVGKIIVIFVLAFLALAIAALFLLFIWQNRPDSAPSSSATPSITSTASPTPTTSETPGASPSAVPSPDSTAPTPEPTVQETEPTTPVTEAPSTDAELQAFTDQVTPPLDEALTGFSLVSTQTGQDAVAIVDNLLQDAQRLSDTPAPTSISGQWTDAVTQYSARLQELRAGYDSAGDVESLLSGTEAAIYDLRNVVGI